MSKSLISSIKSEVKFPISSRNLNNNKFKDNLSLISSDSFGSNDTMNSIYL